MIGEVRIIVTLRGTVPWQVDEDLDTLRDRAAGEVRLGLSLKIGVYKDKNNNAASQQQAVRAAARAAVKVFAGCSESPYYRPRFQRSRYGFGATIHICDGSGSDVVIAHLKRARRAAAEALAAHGARPCVYIDDNGKRVTVGRGQSRSRARRR